MARRLLLLSAAVFLASVPPIFASPAAAATPTPLDIVALIDHSDSMELRRASEWCPCPPPNDPEGFRFSAAKFLTQIAGDDDRLAFVLFGEGAKVIADLTPVGSTYGGAREDLRAQLDRARTDEPTGLTTDLASGLRAAQDIFANRGAPERRRILVVLTDALSTDLRGQPLVALGRSLNAPVYVVAIGPGADLASADALASATGGVRFHVLRPSQLMRTFADLVGHAYPDLYVDEITAGSIQVSASDEVAELLFVFPGQAAVRIHPQGTPADAQCGVWQAVAALARCPRDPNYHSVQLSDRSRGLSGDWVIEGVGSLGGFAAVRSAISMRQLAEAVPADEPWILALALERREGPIRDERYSALAAVRSSAGTREVIPLRLTASGPGGEPMLWALMPRVPAGLVEVDVTIGIADRPVRLRRQLTLRSAPVESAIREFRFHEAIDAAGVPRPDDPAQPACARDEYSGQVVEVAGGRTALVMKEPVVRVRPDDRVILSGDLQTGSNVAVAVSDLLQATVRVNTLATMGRQPSVSGTIAPVAARVDWSREQACTWVGHLTLTGLALKQPQTYELALSFPDLPNAPAQRWAVEVPVVNGHPTQTEVFLGTVYLSPRDTAGVLILQFDRSQERPPTLQLSWVDEAARGSRVTAEPLVSEDPRSARYAVRIEDDSWRVSLGDETFRSHVQLQLPARFKLAPESVELTWQYAGVVNRFFRVLTEPRPLLLGAPLFAALAAMAAFMKGRWMSRHPALAGAVHIDGRSEDLSRVRLAWIAEDRGKLSVRKARALAGLLPSGRPRGWLLELRGQLKRQPVVYPGLGKVELQKVSPDGRSMTAFLPVTPGTELPTRAKLRFRRSGLDAEVAYQTNR